MINLFKAQAVSPWKRAHCSSSDIGHALAVIPSRMTTHALGCNKLSALMQSRYNETKQVLCEFVCRLSFSSSREGRYSQLSLRTSNPPCTLGLSLQPPPRACPRSRRHLGHPYPGYFRHLFCCLHPWLCRCSSGCRHSTETFWLTAWGICSARSLFKPRGGAVLVPCNSSAKPPTPLLSGHGTSVPSASPMYIICVPPAVRGAVPIPVSHSYRCNGPPHRLH
jgi:hypothetical protein